MDSYRIWHNDGFLFFNTIVLVPKFTPDNSRKCTQEGELYQCTSEQLTSVLQYMHRLENKTTHCMLFLQNNFS